MEKIQCIYKITNIVNKKTYIGSAIDFNRRKRRHFNLLRKNSHHSIKLQNSFNKHGENNFIFEIIEYVDDISIRKSHLGLKQSEETKKNKSDSLIKFWENVSIDSKKKRSEKINKTRIENGGYVVSEEMKQQISKTLKEKNLQSAISVEIEKIGLDGIFIEKYPSLRKAEIANGFGSGILYYNIIKKNKKIYKGFIWKIKK